MKHPIKGRNAGKATHKNGETRATAPTVSGLKIKNKQGNGSGSTVIGKAASPAKGRARARAVKAVDSRTAVIAKARLTKIAKAVEVTTAERITELHAIRDAYPGNSVQIQCDRLLAMIKQTGSISTFEAMRFGDIFDPRARKLNLIKMGYAISMVWRWVVTESGDAHRVGVYFMATETTTSSSQQRDLFSHSACTTSAEEVQP